jgi:hypothetical protein
MNRQELIDRLTRQSPQWARESRARLEKLPGDDNPLQPGDLYTLAVPDATPIRWLLVKRGPDDPRALFFIPADDTPAVGGADLAVGAEEPWGPCTLRCGAGLWIDESTLRGKARRAGRLGQDWLDRVQKVLHHLVRGSLSLTVEQKVGDLDPDLQDWLDEVGSIRRQTADWLNRGQLIPWEDLAPAPPAVVLTWYSRQAAPQASRLAASGSGLRGRIARRLDEARQTRWATISQGPSGSLLVQAGHEGVRAVWSGAEADRPELSIRDGQSFRSLRWSFEDSVLVSEILPWQEQEVELRLGGPEGEGVTIRR